MSSKFNILLIFIKLYSIMIVEFSSQRLRFYLIEESDADFIYELMNTEKWLKFIGDRGIQKIEDAKQYILEKMSPDIAKAGFVNYKMIEKSSGKAVGTCSLHDRKGVKGMDVGYALLPEFEGKGYAKEGAMFIINLAKEKYNQKKISAITTAENRGSCRLLERLGFDYEDEISLPNSVDILRLYVKSLFL